MATPTCRGSYVLGTACGNCARLEGAKLIHSFPEGEGPVSMVTFRDHVYVATGRGVYRIEGDELVPLKIQAGYRRLTE